MLLLVQFRNDRSGPHELKCVQDTMNIPYSDIQVFNPVSKHANIDDFRQICRKADAVVLGGWGENGYWETNPIRRKAFEDMKNPLLLILKEEVIEKDKPCLGICFGFELLADALGAEIGVDPDQAESGIVDITLTDEGRIDPLLSDMDDQYQAVAGHKASVLSVPSGAVKLSSSTACPIHAIRYGKNIYGFMSHPELDYDELMFRLNLYPAYKKNKAGILKKVDIQADKIALRFAQTYISK